MAKNLKEISDGDLLEALDNSFSSISHMYTFAPDDKNFFAISSPNPWAPPVITAVLFLRSN